MRINLLPDIVLKRRKDARTKQLATMALAGWFIVLAVVVIGVIAYRGIQNNRLASAKKTREKVNAEVNSKENVAIRSEAQSVQTALLSLSELYSKQAKLSVVGSKIASVTPAKVKLKNLTINETGSINFAGDAPSYNDASTMVAALKATAPVASSDETPNLTGYFTGVFLNGVNRSEVGVTFSVSGVYVPPVISNGVSK